ncbi:hypothetical protein K4K58_009771 [Colletotrichum sp. SAR11_239]|nr:hypothetical protein K4K58_009771 [Colletotrichum sp. SAR11_239]
MEPASLALGVVSVFKDAYLTAKFIRNTIQSIKGYEAEQSQLVTRYNVQIYRLKNLSRLFRAADDNLVDMKLLKTVPDEYLNTVKELLMQLQKVLAHYTQHAAFLDDDYRRFSPSSPHFKHANSFEIDDSHGGDEAIELAPNVDDEAGKQALAQSKWWPFRGSRKGDKKTTPRSKKLISIQSLPLGVRWVFRRSKLEETLQAFEKWNQNLEYMIPPLLEGFGFYDKHKNLRDRLRADGDQDVQVNIFQGHVELNRLANDDPSNELQDNENCIGNAIQIPYEDAEAKVTEARILVEYKQIVTQQETVASKNIIQPIKQLYGPQLARLLRTAGEHSFRTLPFNSYAWNAENAQYIFLFDYPINTADRVPKSLNDLILSSELQPQYKLELRQRFLVAQTMAGAIGAFHSDGWLHKSIRAHAVKFFFFADGNSCDFGNPYLTDFEFSRPLAGITRLAPQAIDLEHDVYRHPDRHGLPGTSFSKMHDIYSLGVVLLEIGLWQTARQIHDDVIKYEREGDALGPLKPQEIKEAFLQDARERLAHRMGALYQEAVVACLDGDWDELAGSRDFAKEFYKRVVQKVDIKAFAA